MKDDCKFGLAANYGHRVWAVAAAAWRKKTSACEFENVRLRKRAREKKYARKLWMLQFPLRNRQTDRFRLLPALDLTRPPKYSWKKCSIDRLRCFWPTIYSREKRTRATVVGSKEVTSSENIPHVRQVKLLGSTSCCLDLVGIHRLRSF